jgi:hypothetical protein
MDGTRSSQPNADPNDGNEAEQIQHLLDGDLLADLFEVDSGHRMR